MSNMGTVGELQKEAEISVIQELIRQLRGSGMDKATAKQCMKTWVDSLPFQDLSDAKTKITLFTAQFPAFTELALILKRHEDYLNTQSVIEKMRTHMQTGAHDQAVEVATQHSA